MVTMDDQFDPGKRSPRLPLDDPFAGSLVPWWELKKLHWLVIAPLLAMGLVGVLSNQIRSAAGHAKAVWWSDRAQVHLLADDLEGAEEKLGRAIQAMPMAEHLYFQRAQVRRERMDYRGSMADYDIVVALAPTYATAYMGRAIVRWKLGLIDEAMQDLDEAVHLRPSDDPSPLNLRAYLRALSGRDLPKARQEIERAIALSPKPRAAFLDTLAYVKYRQGEIAAAVTTANQAVQLGEQNLQALDQLIERQVPLDRRRRFERLVHEDLAVIYYHRAQIQATNGDTVAAQADLDRAYELGFHPSLE